MSDFYNEVWNKIRGARINCIDFLLSCGFGETKRQICDWFLNNELLKERYIDGVSVKSMAKKRDVYDNEVSYRLAKEVDIIKIRLAENNCFWDIKYKDDEKFYEYLRKRIIKQGVTYVYLNDGVSVKDISVALEASENAVKHVIVEDKKRIKKMLNDKRIKVNQKGLCFYIRTFGETYKFCENIPFVYLDKVGELIRNNRKLEDYISSSVKYSNEEEQNYIELLDEIEFDMKKYLENIKKRVSIKNR